MAEVIYIDKKVNKDLKTIEIEMNKMVNKMINLINKRFKAMKDQILEIDDKIDEIEDKLWPDYFYIEAVNNSSSIAVTGFGTGELKYTKTPEDDSSWTTQNITRGSSFSITFDAGERYYFVGDIINGGGTVKFVSPDDIRCGGNVYYVANKNGKLSQDYQCYQMFYDCRGLLNAPELPAMTLTAHCYEGMFYGTSITTAPKLPAMTLAEYCYRTMFFNTPLTTAPILPATTLAVHCYSGMFAATNITTAPELPATILAEYCYADMFLFCKKLNYIKCLATDISAFNCTFDWLEDASATGTFVKDANTTWPSNTSGIPSGWTIVDA